MPSEAVPKRLPLGKGDYLAYHSLGGRAPGILFLGGFLSDMTGKKAIHLDAFARKRGQAFLRFDYRGHGQSSGRFEDGDIGRWRDDALAVLDRLTVGPQILVGSSMGGWIALLAACARPDRVAALVGVAAAPDFTEDLLWQRLDPEIQAKILQDGVVHLPSDYSESPYSITKQLIEDGRRHLLLNRAIPIRCPVRLLHGQSDPDVPWQTSIHLAQQLESDDVRVTLIKAGNHRLSDPQDLDCLEAHLDQLIEQLSAV